MLDGYSVLAPVYDILNETVDYGSWANFIEKIFCRFKPDGANTPKTVLELGCGTGSMTIELARRGYDVIALDISDEMLSVADQRAREAGASNIRFIQSDMCSFELYGKVDAVVCCLDGINHLTARDELDSCFALVSNYLNNGGLFVFDLNTPYKFKTVYADRDYILEDAGIMCCWRNRLSKAGDRVDFHLSVFREDREGHWHREDGIESERAYGRRLIENALRGAGLELVDISAGYEFEKITPECERWYITARKEI